MRKPAKPPKTATTPLVRQHVIAADERLPLTCARKGICCHNKAVWLNPWELHTLATAAGICPRIFRDQKTIGGIRLRMDGPAGWKALPACCMYDLLSGCRAHAGRPLACRLYPLGRRQSGERVDYVYEGEPFPCLEGCAEVEKLPLLTLEEYLAGQEVEEGLRAQEAYLELMQDLAEGALVLLLDSGLAASGDRETLPLWKKLGALSPEARARMLPPEWYDRLTLAESLLPNQIEVASGGEHNPPTIPANPRDFVKAQHVALQQRAQESFSMLTSAPALREASGWMMAMALHIGASLGIETSELAARWINTARKNGARS